MIISRVDLLTLLVLLNPLAPVGAQQLKPDGDGIRRVHASKLRIVTPIKQLRVLAYSPTGDILAGGGDGPDVYLWDTASGEEVGRLPGHQPQVSGLAFSPDGKHLATGGAWGVKLWDVKTRNEISSAPTPLRSGSQQATGRLVFSPKGDLLAAVGNKILVWDLKQKRVLSQLPGGFGVVFSPDGRLVACIGGGSQINKSSGSSSAAVSWFNSRTGKPFKPPHPALGGIKSVQENLHRSFANLAFSFDGRYAATSGELTLIDLVSKMTWQLKGRLKYGQIVAFTPDARAVVLTTYVNSTVVELPSGKILGLIVFSPGDSPDDAVVLSPDGNTLAVARPVHRYNGKIVPNAVVALWDVGQLLK